ncbi:MAG: 3-phosphoshikimate 1-carboxyvinyltransferase [Bacteroidetes bacterium]|nr:3-phosphoshikimate 1-carboxyvinyltransferase [Bacteroidota bacterium]
MDIYLSSAPRVFDANLQITGSKSETNRLLLLAALYPNLRIQNTSNADDATAMQKGLLVESGLVDVHHAGTAMRFLTAFFASQPGREITLTGSKRMTERPIKILVDALRQLDADISYLGEEGFPPLKIKGKTLHRNYVKMQADVSSQYISALLLNAPQFENGIQMELEGQITSVPYINMTLQLLHQLGIEAHFQGNSIRVMPEANVQPQTLTVESDWSSASYFYSIAALAEVGSKIQISAYKKDSLQGDSVLQALYTFFGVHSTFAQNTLTIHKKEETKKRIFSADLVHAPDIAQTIVVTCFGLGLGCDLSGLHTLKIKETDRLKALKTELSKLGAAIHVTDKSLHLKPHQGIKQGVSIDTYNDHRMAMSFAPLAIKVPIIVKDAEVVSKSYPDFWKDLSTLGFVIKEK